MIQSIAQPPFSNVEYSETGVVNAQVVPTLDDVLARVQAIPAPLWPLKDYVAVNPFLGLSDKRFLAARQQLRQVRDGDMLMPLEYFRELIQRGHLSIDDLSAALDECVGEYPELFAELSIEELQDNVKQFASNASFTSADRCYWTVAEAINQSHAQDWASTIKSEVSRHCAAHYDEGQSLWPNPWKHLTLYAAWRESAQIDKRMEQFGVRGFRRFVASLPDKPEAAIRHTLQLLRIPGAHWEPFLLCQLFSIPGWTAYVKYRVREAEMAGGENPDLLGLLAIRLAYDCGLIAAKLAPEGINLYPEAVDRPSVKDVVNAEIELLPPSAEALTRYWVQVAAEIAYRRRLCGSLASYGNPRNIDSRKQAQFIFCIDVRSEVMRRHLEAVSQKIETFGFAGFFGLPFEFIPLGAAHGAAQCPVLLKPSFSVTENLRGADSKTLAIAINNRNSIRLKRKVWKSFQASAASCFSFVESMGLTYAGKLIADSLQLGPKSDRSRVDGIVDADQSRLGPVLNPCSQHGLSVERQTDMAEGMLRNLGLTHNFARSVVICGHASETVNNPYRAGLDCGACGGHSGEANARVAALMLNNSQVRLQLNQRGITIPEDVWFLAAVHNTTTDVIHLFDVEQAPTSHLNDVQQLQSWVATAGAGTRVERAERIGGSAKNLFARSRDWSEVRPEWGLAGNAAFIVAPRSRTNSLRLDGRTFMHSYDYRLDHDWKVLELIMTAPMVVTNWINLQYYASTVDNQAYGSGNKVLHNVVGLFGTYEGNGGDLMTGLPWQSVHDGRQFQHEPLRLLVVIEAPREPVANILAKHAGIRELVCNGWLSLIVIESNVFYRFSAAATWEPWTIGPASTN